MADISDALTRLAGLRDRGILTEQEFDLQKAALLNAPAAAVAPPLNSSAPTYAAAPSSKTIFYIGGGVVLLVIAAVILWATGTLAHLGIGSSSSNGPSTLTTSGTSPFGGATAAPATPYGSSANTTAPGPLGTAASIPPAGTSATTTVNPLAGYWVVNGSPGDRCPTAMSFSAASVIIYGTQNGEKTNKVVPMNFAVQGPTTVIMTAPSDPSQTTTAQISGTGDLSLSDGSCTFHRL